MGLDQNAFSIKKADLPLLNTQEYFDGKLAIESIEELMYWRKHANLQGWATAIFDQTGQHEVFNGQNLVLVKDDLFELRQLVLKGELETATGFFWGTSDEEHDKMTLEFIDKALQAIDEDKVIIYTCSW